LTFEFLKINMANQYKIDQKILTLAECAVMDNEDRPASFKVEDTEFIHLDFNYCDGWTSHAWVASAIVEAENWNSAFSRFIEKLSRLIPRISLIAQAYIEYLTEPLLIHKVGSEVALFRYVKNIDPVGLMFMENEKGALIKLLSDKEIPENFYYYWNDAVNAVGYSAKLLLMFSAIEALSRNLEMSSGKKFYEIREDILGKDLAGEIFRQNDGLRHRLSHGHYFDGRDNGKNYIEIIHQKIIQYFNAKIIKESLICEDVKHPQRNFFGNKEGGYTFIKTKDDGSEFNLKDVLHDFDNNTGVKYERHIDDSLWAIY